MRAILLAGLNTPGITQVIEPIPSMMAPQPNGASIKALPERGALMRTAAILFTLAIAACAKEPVKDAAPADTAPCSVLYAAGMAERPVQCLVTSWSDS